VPGRLIVVVLSLAIAGSEASAEPDTLWFGGLDPVTGLAVEGGIWDFEDGTTQGWTSVDHTDQPVFFTHVTADSHSAHGDPVDCVIRLGGSVGSMWLGAHEDYARDHCWPGGQGYSNEWRQKLAKSFVYGGSGSIVVEYDYFVDSETEFDFTYVYILGPEPYHDDILNTSAHPNDIGYGYSGAVEEGTAIGSPDNPAHDEISTHPTWLDSVGMPFTLEFHFASDYHFSDGLDGWSWFLNSVHGPFGVDNISVSGTGIDDFSDFEPTGVSGGEYDGWLPDIPPPVGQLLGVYPLDALDPPTDEDCVLDGCVMIAADTSDNGDWNPHRPYRQHECLLSNPIAVDRLDDLPIPLIQWHTWDGMDRHLCFGYRIAMHYFPWTCPDEGWVGWTEMPAGDLGFILKDPGCYSYTIDNSQFLPIDEVAPDSIKLVIELMLVPGMDGGFCVSGQFDTSPYFDNIRVGFTALVVDVADDDPAGPPSAVTTLHASTPNPVDRPTTIRFTLGNPARVSLELFDIHGAHARTLLAKRLGAGDHRVDWDVHDQNGQPVGAGVYWVRMTTSEGFKDTRRLVLVR